MQVFLLAAGWRGIVVAFLSQGSSDVKRLFFGFGQLTNAAKRSHKHIGLTTNFRRQIRRITLYHLRFLLDHFELKHHQAWVGHRP